MISGMRVPSIAIWPRGNADIRSHRDKSYRGGLRQEDLKWPSHTLRCRERHDRSRRGAVTSGGVPRTHRAAAKSENELSSSSLGLPRIRSDCPSNGQNPLLRVNVDASTSPNFDTTSHIAVAPFL